MVDGEDIGNNGDGRYVGILSSGEGMETSLAERGEGTASLGDFCNSNYIWQWGVVSGSKTKDSEGVSTHRLGHLLIKGQCRTITNPYIVKYLHHPQTSLGTCGNTGFLGGKMKYSDICSKQGARITSIT